MNVLFLGSLFPPDRNREISQNCKGYIQNASDNLQWAIIKGLDNYFNNLNIITLPTIASYPLGYRKWYFKGSCFNHKSGSDDHCIGFLNFPFINLLSRYINTKRALKKWSVNKTGNSHLIIYAIHTPFLKAAIHLKRTMPNLKICLIVPDLPQYMSDSNNLLYKLLKKIDSILINKSLEKIDSFVLLSDNMTDALNIGNRPWTMVEGIFEKSNKINFVPKEKNKTILYTGAIARSYGIINLLEAFDAIKNSNYRLWICGEGDCRAEIEKRAKSDKRIEYFGMQPRTNILTMQKKATVLVNPRTSEGEFTKYSFPSKTMEYLASGTPCVLFKLQGIPEEYFQYCFVVKKENIESLKEMIMTVCEKDQTELDEFGKKAAQFIIENKNPVSQVKKIYKMLCEL